MSTEVFFRNPSLYIRQIRDVGVPNLIWDMGHLAKMKIDPKVFADLNLRGRKWKSYIVGRTSVLELNHDTESYEKAKIHPIFRCGQSPDVLEALLEGDKYEKIFVFMDGGGSNTSVGRVFHAMMSDMIREHPEKRFHLHGSYSFMTMFDNGYHSADFDARTPAAHGGLYLPNGSKVFEDSLHEVESWINAMGFTIDEVRYPGGRCEITIKSVVWAGEYFNKAVEVGTQGFEIEVDLNNFRYKSNRNGTKYLPQSIKMPETAKQRADRLRRASSADFYLCNSCSFKNSCKLFREGAICTMANSDAVDLASYFGSRDSNNIIEGLGRLLAAESKRVQRAITQEAMDAEDDASILRPEVTRAINGLFEKGVKLAKLVDPALAGAGAPKVNVQANILNASTNGGSVTPQALVSSVVHELEAAGVAPEDITEEMIQQVLTEAANAEEGVIMEDEY